MKSVFWIVPSVVLLCLLSIASHPAPDLRLATASIAPNAPRSEAPRPTCARRRTYAQAFM